MTKGLPSGERKKRKPIKKSRSKFAWSSEIQALAQQSADIMEAVGGSVMAMALYRFVENGKVLNRSLVIRSVVGELAKDASSMTHQEWVKYANAFMTIPKDHFVGPVMDLDTPFDPIIRILEQWDWLDYKGVLVEKGKAFGGISKSAIIVIALLRFVEKHSVK